MAKLAAAARPGNGKPLQGLSVFYTLTLALLAVLVLYPLILLIIQSFVVELDDGRTAFGIGNWVIAWNQPGMVESIVNTFNRVFITELITFPVAILFVWLVARTDVPGKSALDFLMWIAFFLPNLPVLMGWILLLDPKFGLVNQVFVNVFGMEQGPFNIYTFWGIVWAHIVTKSVAAKYIFMLPSFRNMDSTLEEASQICGYGKLGTLARTVVPIMMPAILVTLIISLIHSLESFETEVILGAPTGFYVFSTKIYQLMIRDEPLFGAATVLGVVVLLSMVPLIFYQYWISTRRKFTTVTSHFKANPIRLGPYKWLAFTLVLVFGLISTVIPFIFLVMGTFMRLFGFFDMDQPWTLNHWQNVLTDPILLKSLGNTLKLAIGASLIGIVWYSILAYISVRSKYKARGMVEFLTWPPASIPGILLGLGMLYMFLEIPVLRPLYGSIFVLIVTVLISSMTTGVQLIKSNMVQLGNELEEASSVSGGSWAYTYRKILLPILGPVLLSVATITFITASRSVSNIAMLVTSENRPLSMLQLDYMVDGKYEAAAIAGVFVMILTVGVAIVARIVGRKFGMKV